MPPSSHFLQYFPLVIDSLAYGIYSVLFFQSVQSLLGRRCPNYRFHLGCIVALFLLSTVHVIMAWAWAFVTDTAMTAIFEVFSLDNPPPALFGPDDATHFAPLIKLLYLIANIISDGILIYRCYVIWGHDWYIVAAPGIAFFCTIISGIAGIFAVSRGSELVSVAVCLGIFTNTLASSLAAGRIWWICSRASYSPHYSSHRKYSGLTAILLESGLIYPAWLIITIGFYLNPMTSFTSVLICIAALYHLVGIATTLIIMRVGLGVSTDDVEKCITLSSVVHPTKKRLRTVPPDLELGAPCVDVEPTQNTLIGQEFDHQ